MSQSSLMVGLLAAAFLLFLAARGRLPVYAATLFGDGGGANGGSSGGSSGGSGGGSGGIINSIIKAAPTVIETVAEASA